ncbi:uncharacterized protein LOC107363076 [Tetranychus urticae]|uniref:Uncharacterized protein n=1 Tax=Tetranychus urticae TaxID=32264 RepID=T1KEC4_TETUR|nr:uncharacterized protein LOC107363076 [Tetranychus urticae]
MEKELKDLFEDDFLEPLSAFCESLESNDIDTLLTKFEEDDPFIDFVDDNFSLFDVSLSPSLENEFSTSSHQFTSNVHQERRRSSSNSISTIKVADTKVDCSSRCGNWKVVKQETKVICSSSRNDVKKVKKKKVTGISLLAKPPKVNKTKKQLNGTRICPTRFAAYFYQHHDYCSNPNKIANSSAEATASSP